MTGWPSETASDPSHGSTPAWLLALVPEQIEDSPSDLGKHEKSHQRLHLKTLESHRTVFQVLDTLTVEQRLALDLAYFRGSSVSEIASVLGTSKSTVRGCLRQTVDYLQATLGESRVGQQSSAV